MKVDPGGFLVEGELHNGRLDRRHAGDGSQVTTTGVVTDQSISGELAQGDVVGTWKATRPERRPQSAPTMHTFEPRTFRARRALGDTRLEAFALNVLAMWSCAPAIRKRHAPS